MLLVETPDGRADGLAVDVTLVDERLGLRPDAKAKSRVIGVEVESLCPVLTLLVDEGRRSPRPPTPRSSSSSSAPIATYCVYEKPSFSSTGR